MTIAGERDLWPALAAPPRPARPLSTWKLLRIGLRNSLAACDDALFDELFVERRFLWHRAFVVSDPDGVKRVLQDNFENYPRLSQNRRVFHFGSGGGMLSIHGETWRRHRRLINPALDHRAAQRDAPTLIQVTADLLPYLDELPDGSELDIGDIVTLWLTLATGHVFAGDDRAIDPMLLAMGQYPGEFSYLDALPLPGFVDRWRRSRRAAEAYFPLLDRMIAERQRADYAGREDLLWKLATAHDRQTGERLSDAELRDEILTLGSTAATPIRPLCWVWYLLATHPAVEERLHAELDAVLGGRPPSVEEIGRLTYLRAIVDETMRLYPPLPAMLRSAVADDTVCGRHIPKNSIVAIVPWVVHRHRKLWEAPDRFDPDRFLPAQAAGRSRYVYLPFSIGPHVCIGASLGMMEIMVGVAMLAQRFRFRLVPDHPVEAAAWTNLRPKYGIRVTLERRGGPVPAG